MSYSIIIPARYASTRLPGKPLLEIEGKPLIQHVYQRATETRAKRIIIATDNQRIADICNAFGAEVCLTRADHQSGTERIAEVIETFSFLDQDIVINLQGDEPDVPVSLIEQTALCLQQNPSADMSTLAAPIENSNDLFNSNIVKAVLNDQNFALYFSRAPIPWHREQFPISPNQEIPKDYQWLRHIGLYGYRCGFLRQYIQWTISPLEQIESLEQLRVLAHGGKIIVDITQEQPAHGIDTEDDLVKARLAFKTK